MVKDSSGMHFDSWDRAIDYLSQNNIGLKINRNKYLWVWNENTESISYLGEEGDDDNLLRALERAIDNLFYKVETGRLGKTIGEDISGEINV